MHSNIDILQIIAIAKKAGEAIMEIYAGSIEVEHKEDNSPLTLADKAANTIIVGQLKQLYADIPIISEENKLLPYAERKHWHRCWLVDPLDGTKEFIKRNGEFTVNIALIEDGHPVLGVVHVPAKNITYYGEKGKGSYKIADFGQPVQLTLADYKIGETLKIVGSRSHNTPEMDALVQGLRDTYGTVEFVPAGSSLKFCLVAEGVAHEYPRLGPTMEWDTCAGQVVAEEAGAVVVEADNMTPLLYNKENLLNPYFLVTNPQVRQIST
jgi:3'(2'), 5'-bisphosphate nucleotidase